MFGGGSEGKSLFDMDLGSDMSHDFFGESKPAHKRKHTKGKEKGKGKGSDSDGDNYGAIDLARDAMLMTGSLAAVGILGATTVAVTKDLLD